MPPFKPRDTERARSLRNTATAAERELWRYLSRRQIDGCKFSRQMPVGPFFVDFLCRAHALIVELDGPSHDARLDYDEARTRKLEAEGHRLVLFTNADVFERIEGVIHEIRLALADSPTPNPSRKREGDPVA